MADTNGDDPIKPFAADKKLAQEAGRLGGKRSGIKKGFAAIPKEELRRIIEAREAKKLKARKN